MVRILEVRWSNFVGGDRASHFFGEFLIGAFNILARRFLKYLLRDVTFKFHGYGSSKYLSDLVFDRFDMFIPFLGEFIFKGGFSFCSTVRLFGMYVWF